MADNIVLSLGTEDGDTLRSKDRGSAKTSISLLDTGGSAGETLVDATHGLTTNIIQVGGTAFALGQGLAAASLPVVLTAAQLATLTPPAIITGFALDATLSTLSAKVPALGQALAAASVPIVLTASQLSTLTPLSTVAVTGTFYQATQPISGTVTANAGTGPFPTAGTIASGASDSGNPVKVGGVYNSSAPTFTTGQRGDIQLDSSGNLKVNVSAGGASGGTSSSFGSSFPATGTAIGFKDSGGTNLAAGNLDASGYLKVNVAAGSGGNGAASATAAAVPASADYVGVNVGGTLRGQTAVNPTGTVYAAQTDLSSIGGTSFALGQALAAASVPVVMTAAQVTTLTPPAAITGFALDASISSLSAKVPALGQALAAASTPVVLTAAQISTLTPLSTVAVTGTFWQATQPVSIATLPALAAGSAVIGHVIVDTAPSTAVTNAGTFATQAAQSGTWNVGTVTTVTTVSAVTAITNALPAGTNLLGSTSAGLQTGQVYSGTTALTVKFAFVAITSSGNTTVVAAVTSKKIRVLSYAYQGDTAANVYFKSATAGAITSTKPCLANQPLSKSESSLGHFETTSGEALQINVSVAQTTAGVDVVYVEV